MLRHSFYTRSYVSSSLSFNIQSSSSFSVSLTVLSAIFSSPPPLSFILFPFHSSYAQYFGSEVLVDELERYVDTVIILYYFGSSSNIVQYIIIQIL